MTVWMTEEQVCDEIVAIMREYDRQEAESGYVDTPGGFEHLGDVWRTMRKWSNSIHDARKARAGK